jgi:hypothetical protein
MANFIFSFSLQNPFFTESGSGKRFHVPGIRAIDLPHKITPRGLIFRKISGAQKTLKKSHFFGPPCTSTKDQQ